MSHLVDYHLIMKNDPILARFTICKLKFVHNYKISFIAKITNTHRNTVSNIISLFKKGADISHYQLLASDLSLKEIHSHFAFLAPKSRRPLSNKRAASPQAEQFVLSLARSTWFGFKRLFLFIKRNNPSALSKFNLSFSKIKGIYKKHNIKVRKSKSKNRRYRPIFDYKSLHIFQYLLYDTKHILDISSLPPHIYHKFSSNPEIPIYEYNIFDAKSWFRFIAYSHQLNSTFGFYFLKFVLMFIRSIGYDLPITVLFDWWAEFVSNSPSKLNQWNELLSILNTSCQLYSWPRDVRKNLIERSHRIDDEEFFSPRWDFINSKSDFLKEAHDYRFYYNFQRISSSKYRFWKTPFDIISSHLKPFYFKYFLNFPTLILDDAISDLMYYTKNIDTLFYLKKHPPDLTNPKSVIDWKYKFNLQNNIFAQNVFELYLLKFLQSKYYFFSIIWNKFLNNIHFFKRICKWYI